MAYIHNARVSFAIVGWSLSIFVVVVIVVAKLHIASHICLLMQWKDKNHLIYSVQQKDYFSAHTMFTTTFNKCNLYCWPCYSCCVNMFKCSVYVCVYLLLSLLLLLFLFLIQINRLTFFFAPIDNMHMHGIHHHHVHSIVCVFLRIFLGHSCYYLHLSLSHTLSLDTNKKAFRGKFQKDGV